VELAYAVEPADAAEPAPVVAMPPMLPEMIALKTLGSYMRNPFWKTYRWARQQLRAGHRRRSNDYQLHRAALGGHVALRSRRGCWRYSTRE
jgi:hypothetical protein